MVTSFVLLTAFGTSVAAADEFDDKVKGIDASFCKRKHENAVRIDKAYRDPSDRERAPKGCMDAVQKAYETCAKIQPEKKQEPAGGDNGADADASAVSAIGDKGVRAQPAMLKSLLKTGKAKNEAKAQECKDQRAAMKKACDESDGQLRSARDQNGRERRELESKLAQSRDGGAEIKRQIQEHQETGYQLDAQIRNLGRVSSAGETALEDYEKCFAADAQKDQIEADRANTIVASASGQGEDRGTNEAKVEEAKSLNEPATDGRKHHAHCEIGSNDTNGVCDAVIEQGAVAAKESAVKVGLRSLATNVAAGASVAAGAAAEASPSLMRAAGGALWKGSTPVFALLGMTVPANGPCADLHTTNWDADLAGCGVAINSAASATGP